MHGLALFPGAKRGLRPVFVWGIGGYKKVIAACDGVDYVTQDLAIELLADDEEHLTLFAGFKKSLEK